MQEKPVKEMRRNWVLFALMITMMLAAMDNTIVATAIPQIVGDLGGFSLFSWLFSIYLLIQTITIPVYGKLADIYGRKPILIIGIIIFLIGSAACAGAWNMHSLIFFRGLQAVGAGAIMATVNTVAGDIYTIKERAKIQGWLSSVWGISAIMGPAVGGALADYASWRWIFLINIPIGLGAIALIVLFLHENKSHKGHKIDWAGAVAMLVTGTVIMFGLLQGGQSWPWFSLNTLGIIALSVVLIMITIRIERKSAEPILPRWVWKKRVILGANLATIGMGIMTMGPNMFLPVFAQSVTGVGAIAAGFILASMSITWPLSSALSGNLYLRIGFRNTAICGIIIVIIGAASFLFLPFPGPVWYLVAVQMTLGAGFGLITTPLLVGIQSTVEWGQRGVVTGTSMFSRYFGQSIGAAVFAAVFNSSLTDSMENAPARLQSELPSVNKVVEVLQSHKSVSDVSLYLRESFFAATHNVYLGMVIAGLVTLVILLLTPAKFPSIEEVR
ncbi:arabinose efflux permease family protein [Aequorivita sublithincola DSM 14238]|uniref:Arabinose efflux permease family protein n=1 Tax=Aequorivita sublithincola (strain DSM 14238 / LMG 21431 / ACAM 643 / 9-3) TaxID=746697 RepID=I3YWR5_AEQSU|nr:MFS transporter [Aequorivita sublithincola]AFL81433.1 arabinose efflux permease family protein [Aequorivita sublithincola DSM 14238]